MWPVEVPRSSTSPSPATDRHTPSLSGAADSSFTGESIGGSEPIRRWPPSRRSSAAVGIMPTIEPGPTVSVARRMSSHRSGNAAGSASASRGVDAFGQTTSKSRARPPAATTASRANPSPRHLAARYAPSSATASGSRVCRPMSLRCCPVDQISTEDAITTARQPRPASSSRATTGSSPRCCIPLASTLGHAYAKCIASGPQTLGAHPAMTLCRASPRANPLLGGLLFRKRI